MEYSPSRCISEIGRPFNTVDRFRSCRHSFGHGRCHSVSFAYDGNHSRRDFSTPHRYSGPVKCSTPLTEVSLCLGGAQKEDGWFFVGVEFPINIGGGLTDLQGELTQSTVRVSLHRSQTFLVCPRASWHNISRTKQMQDWLTTSNCPKFLTIRLAPKYHQGHTYQRALLTLLLYAYIIFFVRISLL
jgi:hypothetical protein